MMHGRQYLSSKVAEMDCGTKPFPHFLSHALDKLMLWTKPRPFFCPNSGPSSRFPALRARLWAQEQREAFQHGVESWKRSYSANALCTNTLAFNGKASLMPKAPANFFSFEVICLRSKKLFEMKAQAVE